MAVTTYDLWDPRVMYGPPPGQEEAMQEPGPAPTSNVGTPGATGGGSYINVDQAMKGAITSQGGARSGETESMRIAAERRRNYVPSAGLPREGAGYGRTPQYKQPIGQTTVSKTVFKGERPTLDLPERSEERVKALTRKAMAPRLRSLRTALNRALVRSYENPNVRRMIVREALQGYGAGVEEARYGAERTAEAQESAERATAIQEALANYQGAMQEYIGSAERVQTTKQQFAGSLTDTQGGTRVRVTGTFGRPSATTMSSIWNEKPPESYFG